MGKSLCLFQISTRNKKSYLHHQYYWISASSVS